MAPIRVGLIGLSTSSNQRATGAWAVLAHLPAITENPLYTITALCNSSAASAEASIAHHKLGPHVKAYGDAKDLAQDPNVDLVVISVNVAMHFELAKPALLAKKDVFVEWPLGANTSEAEELSKLAHSANVKTMVGLQARPGPLVVKIKDLVDSGRIGQVTSSYVLGSFGGLPLDVWAANAKYYLDAKSGGNPVTIHFGHFLDTYTYVLGDFARVQSILRTQYPTVKLLDDATGAVIDPEYRKTTPDHILVQGILQSGAVASLDYRSVMKSVDGVGVRWLITGTKGEIEVVTPEIAWQMGPPGATLKLRNTEDGTVENVDFAASSEGTSTTVPFPGTNTALLYREFGKETTGSVPDFKSALKTHRLLDTIFAGSE